MCVLSRGAAHDNSCRREQSVSVPPSSSMRQSRCGRIIRPPIRYRDD